LASLGALLVPVLRTGHGQLLVAGTLVLGLLLPLAIHLGQRLRPPSRSPGRGGMLAAAALALVGGFVLRYAILTTPPHLLARGPDTGPGTPEVGTPDGLSGGLSGFGPEDGRKRGGGPGASPGNWRPGQKPPSKVFSEEGGETP